MRRRLAVLHPSRLWTAGVTGVDRTRQHWRARDPATVGWLACTATAFLAFGHAGLIAGMVLWAVHVAWDPPAPLVGLGAAVVLAAAGLTWLMAGVPQVADVYLVTRRTVPSLLAVVGVVGLATAAWRGSPANGTPIDLDRPLSQARDLLAHQVQPTSRPARLPEAALMRTIAIVTVVWIHALPPEFSTTRVPFDRWLGDVTRFAVPAFVLVAGYLVARHELRPGWTRRRLERLLVPYLVASIVAIGLRSWSQAFPPIEDPVADLLVGATFGPYYFVFAMVALALLTPALLRLRERAAMVVLGASVGAQVVVEVVGGPLFWRVRNPLLWLAFYLGGIVVWRHRDRLSRWTGTWPWWLLAWSLAATLLVVVPDGTPARDVLTLVATWLMLAVLWLAGRETQRLPRVAWWIDGATYPIYLYHLPFVIVVAGPFGSSVLSLGAAAGWTFGLIGAMSVVVIVRVAFGQRSARWLGA